MSRRAILSALAHGAALSIAAGLLSASCYPAYAQDWIAGPATFAFCADPAADRHVVYWVAPGRGWASVDVPGGQRLNRAVVKPPICTPFYVMVDSLTAENTGWRSDLSTQYQLSPDLTGDGIVGAMDFGEFRRGYGTRFNATDFACFRTHYLTYGPGPRAQTQPLECP